MPRFSPFSPSTREVNGYERKKPCCLLGRQPGNFAVHHPGKLHYDGAKDEEVIVQISGVGPSGTKVVDGSGQVK